jgi:transposase
MKEEKEMYKMSQINNIRELAKSGDRNSEIVKITGADVKTIKKYIAIEDFSPAVPASTEHPSKLDPYKHMVRKWIQEDKKNWHKQRHTANRVHARLLAETDFNGSYNIVQRYVKTLRDERVDKATLELVWEAGTAQSDFGEADFFEAGVRTRNKYLVLSFPHSNDSFTQVFPGENAECVCEGLKDIFEYIGGVPSLIVFDNAAGVGRRVYDKIKETELFSRFRSHYRFSVRFCNPRAGNEKGNVENKVGYDRKNLFVPIPNYENIEDYNKWLLPLHEIKAKEMHYKKGVPIEELFLEDKAALADLPTKPFNVCRYEWAKADGYGKVCLDGKHYYSTKPENARKKVLVGIRAHTVDILEDNGDVLVTHKREYADNRTDSIDNSTSLAVLMRNAGAWMNSGLRMETPDVLREYMDQSTKPELKNCLRVMGELSKQYGFSAALSAMEMTAARGNVNICDASVLAARITGYGINTPPEPGPPLTVYDDAFLRNGGECAC